MAHDARSSRWWKVLRAGAVVVGLAACSPGFPDLGDGGVEDDTGLDCDELCFLEDDCGLRSYDACVSESCVGLFRTPSTADECMLVAEDCAEVAACTCAGSCAQLDACTGSFDAACESDCEVLLEQQPIETFQENRCRIESSCEELAACGGT